MCENGTITSRLLVDICLVHHSVVMWYVTKVSIRESKTPRNTSDFHNHIECVHSKFNKKNMAYVVGRIVDCCETRPGCGDGL